MAALPKKKLSKTRTKRRRAKWLASVPTPTLSKCENCGEWKIMHRVCKECGYYRGKQVIPAKTKVKRISTNK